MNFKPGTDMRFVITTDTDPGDLTEIEFYWDHDFEITNPFDWPILDDIEVFISKIEITGINLRKRFVQILNKFDLENPR